MALKITVLLEDSPGTNPILKFEHGLSFFIQKDGHVMLFDTGQSGVFLDNARQLGIDMSKLDFVVLSHGHYDHSGGFRALCEISSGFQLVTGKGFFVEKYSVKEAEHTFKGNNFNKDFLEKKGIVRKVMKDTITELVPGIFAVTHFYKDNTDEVSSSAYKLYDGSMFRKDPFTDEILLAIDTPKGLVVLVGCSHPGIKNMLDTVLSALNRPLYAVLGGIHLIEASEERINSTINYFKKSGIRHLGTCHCTGEKAQNKLKSLGERFMEVKTGSRFSVVW